MNDLIVALITDLFPEEDAGERLCRALARAKEAGAGLALLPELPLNAWAPAARSARDEDAEPPNGPRHRAQAEAARRAGIGVAGGAIVRDPGSGRRFNTALVFDAAGRLAASYRKLHLPHEEGFWETSHYEPGDDLPSVIRQFGLPLGVQICSDINRPQLALALAATGAEAILLPRATPLESYERWKLVMRAVAVTGALFVLSTNRPGPERGVPIGGPSLAVAPDGAVLLETTEPLGVVRMDRGAVRTARKEYPGYLTIRTDLYSRAWTAARGTEAP